MAEEQNIQPNPVIKEHAEAGLAKEITEVRKPSKLLLVLMAMGPGIVTAMAGNDAGGISTYSTVGAKFGFLTLWIIPIMCLLLVVVQTTATRMGAVTGKGFAALIRERFGIRLTSLAMLALLIGNVATTFSEFAGIASGMEHVRRTALGIGPHRRSCCLGAYRRWQLQTCAARFHGAFLRLRYLYRGSHYRATELEPCAHAHGHS